MMIYVLWAFFIGNMAPQPTPLSIYNSKASCEAEMKKLRKDIHWDRWNFSCVVKPPHKDI